MTFEVADSSEPALTAHTAVTVFTLKHLPSLKHLEIRTDLPLAVATLLPNFFQRGGGSKFPALRSLKFGRPQLKIDKWIGFVMRSLKEQGDWASFERLIVPPELSLDGAMDGVLCTEAISEWIRTYVDPKWAVMTAKK